MNNTNIWINRYDLCKTFSLSKTEYKEENRIIMKRKEDEEEKMITCNNIFL